MSGAARDGSATIRGLRTHITEHLCDVDHLSCTQITEHLLHVDHLSCTFGSLRNVLLNILRTVYRVDQLIDNMFEIVVRNIIHPILASL